MDNNGKVHSGFIDREFWNRIFDKLFRYPARITTEFTFCGVVATSELSNFSHINVVYLETKQR